MKIPINSKIRFYSGVLCFIFVLGGAAIVLFNMMTVESLELIAEKHLDILKQYKNAANLAPTLKQFNLIIIILSGGGFLISLLIFITSFRSHAGKYNRIIDKLDIVKAGTFSLSNISFPKEDEFGNLGERLNKLIRILNDFDKMKADKLIASNNKLLLLGNKIEEAICVITPEFRFSFSNNAFNTAFDLKESKEHFKINAVFQSPELEEIINKTIFKNTETREMELSINSKEYKYKTIISCLPVFSNNFKVSEAFIFFHEIKKPSKIKK